MVIVLSNEATRETYRESIVVMCADWKARDNDERQRLLSLVRLFFCNSILLLLFYTRSLFRMKEGGREEKSPSQCMSK